MTLTERILAMIRFVGVELNKDQLDYLRGHLPDLDKGSNESLDGIVIKDFNKKVWEKTVEDSEKTLRTSSLTEEEKDDYRKKMYYRKP